MLTIRAEQLTALSKIAALDFENRMVASLESHYPEKYQKMGEAGARAFVKKAIGTGRQHNVVSQGAVTVYIELLMDYGEGFHLAPERAFGRRLLEHPTLPGEAKVVAIRERFDRSTGGRTIVPHRKEER